MARRMYRWHTATKRFYCLTFETVMMMMMVLPRAESDDIECTMCCDPKQ